jgi:formyltetrahydrofolate deformylase
MDLKPIANQFNIPFFPCSFLLKDNKESGRATNRITEKHEINFIVLARYINHTNLISLLYENKIINIHHSFTGFPGAKPHHLLLKEGKNH